MKLANLHTDIPCGGAATALGGLEENLVVATPQFARQLQCRVFNGIAISKHMLSVILPSSFSTSFWRCLPLFSSAMFL